MLSNAKFSAALKMEYFLSFETLWYLASLIVIIFTVYFYPLFILSYL